MRERCLACGVNRWSLATLSLLYIAFYVLLLILTIGFLQAERERAHAAELRAQSCKAGG